jgi:hypothetical protein
MTVAPDGTSPHSEAASNIRSQEQSLPTCSENPAVDYCPATARVGRVLASAEVHDSTLFFVDFDLQLGQFLAQPFLHRRHQPVMSLAGRSARSPSARRFRPACRRGRRAACRASWVRWLCPGLLGFARARGDQLTAKYTAASVHVPPAHQHADRDRLTITLKQLPASPLRLACC